jgi:hypothetical protein
MKSSLILLILFFGSVLHGQTDSIEKAIIYKKFLSKEISQDELATIGAKWNQTIRQIKKYPDLPLDKSEQVHYTFLREYSGINKEKLFALTLEWLSINYGLFPSNLYSNQSDGKIILRNTVGLTTGNNSTYTSVISIKNEKILTEFFNIGYQTFYDGYFSDGIWIPERSVIFGISQVYPVILKKPSEWNSNLVLLKTTNAFFNSEIENFSHYIKNYENFSVF